MNSADFSLDLIRKYNQPGPRYTSYPTAVQFSAEVPHAELLEDARAGTGALSLYFHLPFCESLCWFCGCTTVISRSRDKAGTYLDYLERELDLMGPHLDFARPVVQLHFGGGTPNFLRPEQVQRVGEMIHRRFAFDPEIEGSVELDPRWLEEAHVKAFREMGVRRASFGVQDVNPAVQKAIHRIQPRDLNLQALDWIRSAGFDSVNIDLVYGLPGQSVESFSETLDEVIGYGPDRLAVFSYAHVPWLKPAQKILERANLPGPDTKLALLQLVMEKLTAAGYRSIGMDHFAREDDDLFTAQREGTLQRNFQGYSTKAGADIAAFGMSAISQTGYSYRQNLKTLDEYYAAIDAGKAPLHRGARLSADDRIRRHTILRLMCDLELDYAALSRTLEIDFAEYFAPELASLDDLEADGLLVRSPTHLQVTGMGHLLIRNIAMRFDAYLKKPQQRRFSRTI